jgi:hypothetical protein
VLSHRCFKKPGGLLGSTAALFQLLAVVPIANRKKLSIGQLGGDQDLVAVDGLHRPAVQAIDEFVNGRKVACLGRID